jgi:hypothetical protein
VLQCSKRGRFGPAEYVGSFFVGSGVDLVVRHRVAGAAWDEPGEGCGGELVIAFVEEVDLTLGQFAQQGVEEGAALRVVDGDPFGAHLPVLCLPGEVAG